MKGFFYVVNTVKLLVILLLLLPTNNRSEIDWSSVTEAHKTPMKSCDSHTTSYINCENELVMAGVCLTRLTNDSKVAGYGNCPYVTFRNMLVFRDNVVYHIDFEMSTLTEQTCGPLNRKGLLCSECYEGYGPAVYAFGNKCVKCHGSIYGRWALYLLVVLLPITAFYIIVIIFNINAASPPLTAFVLYCQLFVTINRIYMPSQQNLTSYYKRPTFLLVLTLSGIWNLDFGRYVIPPFCVSERLNTHHALLLDYVIGFYPMFLIFITYALIKLHSSNFKLVVLLWQPFHRCFAKVRRTWDSEASIVNTFTTFLLLTFSKILFVSFYSIQIETLTILNFTNPYIHHVYYYSPNIRVDNHKFIPFITLSYTIVTAFVFIPTILLCCFPSRLFRKVLFLCCGRIQHTINMFMDTLQGYYKDGTNGTYDWRFLAGFYPLLRIVIMWSFRYSYHRTNNRSGSVTVLCCIIVSAIYSLVRPYKKQIHNRVEILLLSLTTVMMWHATNFQSILGAYNFTDNIGNIIILVLLVLGPHLALALVVIHKAFQLLMQRCVNNRQSNCYVPVYLTIAWSKITQAITGEEEQALDIENVAITSYGTM